MHPPFSVVFAARKDNLCSNNWLLGARRKEIGKNGKIRKSAGFRRHDADVMPPDSHAEGIGALVADHAAGEAGQDWSQGCPPWSLCHVPIGRGCRAEEPVSENPAPDRWSAAKATSTMLNGSLESCRLTEEVRLGDEKLDQTGLRTRSNHQNLAVRRLRR